MLYIALFIILIGLLILLYTKYRKEKIEKYYQENKHILPIIPKVTVEQDKHLFVDCESRLKSLETQAKKHLVNIKEFDIKNIELPVTKCPGCEKATTGWNKFYDSLDRFSQFLRNGTMPKKPEKYADKPCCQTTEKNCEEYMEKVLKEIECLLSAKKDSKNSVKDSVKNSVKDSVCPQTKLPEFSLGNDSCYYCKNIYEKWALITFTLLDIAHYLRMTGMTT